MDKKVIIFKSKEDFRNQICGLIQNQKDDEEYELIFPDKETEKEFDNLINILK